MTPKYNNLFDNYFNHGIIYPIREVSTMVYLGIDVGNSDTKSANTTFVSGYEGPFTNKPLMANHILFYNGKYYSPSITQLYYLKDKTSDERALVLTLISIAKELISRFEKKENATHEMIQSCIDTVKVIGLGVGLPVAHYKATLIENLINYYADYMGNGIHFEYDNYTFQFEMKLCEVYPQGGAAVFSKSCRFTKEYNAFYVVDIGGYTVDVSLFKNGIPCKDRISLDMGVIIMYDNIVSRISMDCDIDIDYNIILDVLNSEKTVLKPDAVAIIQEMTAKHANNIINALRQKKIMFDSYPTIYFGGGSNLLKPFILANPLIRRETSCFISDTRANAKGYERLIKNGVSIKG